MIIPSSLEKGDRVAIVTPSGKMRTTHAIPYAIERLKNWGLDVVLGKNIEKSNHPYLGGTDKERLTDLQWAISDSEIKAIFCARGGYGMTRIVDYIDFQPIQNNPKWIVGYSDITALHIALNHSGIASLHGTMPTAFKKDQAEISLASLQRSLFSEPDTIETGINTFNQTGEAQGVMVGGNLSLLSDSIGTPKEINTDNRILFLEEIDEYHYRIDRMLSHLIRAGKFNNVRGLAIGYMTRVSDPNDGSKKIEELILEKMKPFSFPVGFGFPIGHEEPNYTWVSGLEYKLTIEGGSKLTPIIRPTA